MFDALEGDVFVILEGKGDLRLSNPAQLTVAPNGDRNKDRFDVGYVLLTPEEVEDIGEENFLGSGDLSPRDAAAPRRGYFALGFPASKQERDAYRKVYKTSLMRIATTEVKDKIYEMTKFQRDFHLLLRFNERDMRGPNGQRGSVPNPKGLSGGGIWRVNPLEQYRPDNKPKLVALTIERPPEYGKALLSTRIEAILAAIRKQYPDVASDLRPNPHVQINIRRE
ncbi:MAG TPA: hypothetical protein VFQ76_16175 [Longimicrobiaceae bacterium]|nr:hypothetical protein [Longimicrobiaceae bacterium]